MAQINGIDMEKAKAERTKRQRAQEREIKRMRKESEKVDSTKKEYEHATNVLDVYNNLSADEKKALQKQLEKKKIRDSYIRYIKYVHPKYVFTKFHTLISNICQSIVEKVEKGEKVRICLSVPPQHGKSYSITETLPSWFIGRNPDLRCIVTGYNADMAEKFGDRNRQLVKQYGKDLFGIEISDSQDNKTLWDIAKHEGGMYAAGILGGITGNPGSLIIVDDPYKNGQEAENEDIRNKVYDTFADSVTTRVCGIGNAIIVIHTRWHDDDLIGRLEKLGGWVIINIPAIWESGVDKMLGRKVGETLCPEIGKDADFMLMQKRTLGNKKFNALYQGKPYVEGGNYVKRENLRFYNETTKPPFFEELTLSCDLTFGETSNTSDPYCMTLWGRKGADHYLLNVWDKKANFTDTLRTLRIISSENPQMRRKLIEKKANGKATYDTLNSEIGGFVLFDPKGDSKETRLNSVTPYFESGNVWFPDETLLPNIEDYVTQLLRFPNYAHDDFVDTISQYLLNYEYRYNGRINTDSSMKLLSKAIRGY